MRVNVVATETLHSKIVDKPIPLNDFDLRLNLLVWYLCWNEP